MPTRSLPTWGTDSYRFTHALARQALAAYPNPSRLVRAHRRAAEALAAAGRGSLDPARAAEVAAHYRAGAARIQQNIYAVLDGDDMGIPKFNLASDITPSDTVDIAPTPGRGWPDAIYVGGDGVVAAVFENGSVTTFTAVMGQILPVTVRRVNLTSTTATGLRALWMR